MSSEEAGKNRAPRLALVLSTLANPLLSFPVFCAYALFKTESPETAMLVTALTVFGVAVPLTYRMYRNSQKGVYTNFDVSDRKQRQSWYLLASGLLCLTALATFLGDFSANIRYSFLMVSLLALSSQVLNFWIKSSLHVSFHTFLLFLLATIHPLAAILLSPSLPLLAWSRLSLKRHSMAEVLSGAALGFFFGCLVYQLIADF